MSSVDTEKTKNDSIIIDRGLVSGKVRIHGLNPALLIEKIVREKIQDSSYWISFASTLSFYQLLDECIDNVGVVGIYMNSGKSMVTKFICLLFRLIHLQPSLDVVLYITELTESKYKYVKLLFCLYYRIICEDDKLIYINLEKCLNVYYRVRIINTDGTKKIAHFDELIDDLLQLPQFLGLTLPRLINRWVLEEKGELEERQSELMEEFEAELELLENDG